MDIQQLSKMVRDLILKQDEVVLPGLGTFSAEIEPASFSDRGYTVNPPYRKLSFRNEAAGECSLAADQAEYDACIAELKSTLRTERLVELPELGKLRLTASGECFFVADPDLDIYPDCFGLQPVSMKNHEPQPSEIDLGALAADLGTVAAEPAVVSEPAVAVEPAAEAPAAEPAPEPVVEPAPEPEIFVEPVIPEKPEKKNSIGRIILIVIGVLLAAMLAFRLAAILAPDFIDSLLYTPEELQMLGK